MNPPGRRDGGGGGQWALVTGAGTGIGAAICRELAQAGSNVFGWSHSTASHATEEAVRQEGRQYLAARVDLATVTDAEVAAIVAAAEETIGPIGVLVNNAAVNPRNFLEQYRLEDFDAAYDVNVRAPFILSKCLIARRAADRRPLSIVNVLSLLSFFGGLRTSGYTTAKHGLLGLTRVLANEVADKDITVNAVVPGYIATAMTKDFLASDRGRAVLEQIPRRRWGTPQDVAAAVAYLAHEGSRYIHGTTLVVDGGYSNA